MLILFGILYIAFSQSINGRRRKTQMMSLFTALVEFHKAQCYFISAIQTAALVFARQAYGLDPISHGSQTPPVYDILLSVILSMNGLIPVIFTLSCISLYSRLSWHIIVLTFVTVTLSSGTLISMRKWLILWSSAWREPKVPLQLGSVGRIDLWLRS